MITINHNYTIKLGNNELLGLVEDIIGNNVAFKPYDPEQKIVSIPVDQFLQSIVESHGSNLDHIDARQLSQLDPTIKIEAKTNSRANSPEPGNVPSHQVTELPIQQVSKSFADEALERMLKLLDQQKNVTNFRIVLPFFTAEQLMMLKLLDVTDQQIAARLTKLAMQQTKAVIKEHYNQLLFDSVLMPPKESADTKESCTEPAEQTNTAS